MAREFGSPTSTLPRHMAAILILAAPALAFSLAAQQQGPLPAPSASAAAQPAPPTHFPAASPAPAAKAQSETNAITHEPPAIPVEQIIQKFGERELELKKERDNYTYTQPFVVTTTDLPKYDVKYVGREQVDELSTYVFDVAPKKLEKNQRYFQGRIWVDDKDLNIVKSDGKAVPDIIKKNNENIFPRFETFRENIEGHYWFPTYTRSDDVLHFSTGSIHMRMNIRYANYKRFGATIKIGTPVEIKEDKKPAKP